MKTIRQIADEIGVSKTAVSKQIANLGLRSGLRKNGNQFAIDEHQEALIKQAFSEKSQTEIETQSQTKRAIADRHDLFVSGGTDFHGVIKPDISLGTGRGGMRITTGILDNIKAHLF